MTLDERIELKERKDKFVRAFSNVSYWVERLPASEACDCVTESVYEMFDEWKRLNILINDLLNT